MAEQGVVLIVAVFVSDRGDIYLPGCIESFEDHMPYDIWATHVVDDRDHNLGMAGAVQAGFSWALDAGADYVLWCEEDFRFTEPVPLLAMRYTLDTNLHLAQVVLKRQPWSAEEVRAGGIIEANPGAYSQRTAFGRNCVSATYLTEPIHWVEHEQIFSLNPCLIPRRTLELGWPSGPLGVGNESGMTRRCLDAGMRFAFYGHRDDPPRCTHVGCERAAGWRL